MYYPWYQTEMEKAKEGTQGSESERHFPIHSYFAFIDGMLISCDI